MQAEKIINEKFNAPTSPNTNAKSYPGMDVAIKQAWTKVSPWWPLKNLIATNPLQGFEDLPFETALSESKQFYQNNAVQEHMAPVNSATIKWCQVFFDEGQAAIDMPGRSDGIYQAWRKHIIHDDKLHMKNSDSIEWLHCLPIDPEKAVTACMNKLCIRADQRIQFLTIMLTSLPGWAGFIKYKTEWTQGYIKHSYQLTQTEYLAIRIIMTTLLQPNAMALLAAHNNTPAENDNEWINQINDAEVKYRQSLTKELYKKSKSESERVTPQAQLVFCIDVRSEPFRRAIEAQGSYETFGFAGFFGLPVLVQDGIHDQEYASCPVLLSPQHKVKVTCSSNNANRLTHMSLYKKIYQSLKYTFTTPFALAEAMGPWSGLWMSLRTTFPGTAKNLKLSSFSRHQGETIIDFRIPLSDQYVYAESALRMMGLTKDFAPLVILCGHGSSTENNAYASALDCGACGGHDGATNAKILATILNNPLVRDYLNKNEIIIHDETIFVAGLHHTTTDAVTLYSKRCNENLLLAKLKHDLEAARDTNCYSRHTTLSPSSNRNATHQIQHRSADWAETRPEWGLARNAAFIVGSREITKHINLDGRAFLHSYDWQQDTDGRSLTTILTAPMVVAQWINCQYLFSTLDNVAYGSGSKITHNITGKIGVMQGNASDLMHGLPLQSIAINDQNAYHQPLRLLTIVHAPRKLMDNIIADQSILKKLFGNGWVNLTCLDPTDGMLYDLQRDFSWTHHHQ